MNPPLASLQREERYNLLGFPTEGIYRSTSAGKNCTEMLVLFKLARYGFSGSTPPKFEHKLRRHWQRFGKTTTTVVLDWDENLLWIGLQRHRSRHSNEITFHLQPALGTVLPKLFTGAFPQDSCLDVREI